MKSRWSDADAAATPGLLGERVYTSRLLGQDAALVMHGGGNTSVKVVETDLFGDPVETLYVKGSGSDLATVTEAGFAPVRLDRLVALAGLDDLSDSEMAQQLKLACTREAPAPSVEAILHAILPARYVDHTHADAVLALTNTTKGRRHVEDCYGDQVVVIDYVMPGFALAKRCAREFPESCTDRTIGMVLMNHGVFSFGATARESYERMIDLVDEAEKYLEAHGATDLAEREPAGGSSRSVVAVADLRKALSTVADAPLIVTTTATPRTAAFLARDDLGAVATRGPMTPDHVIRTKRVPLVGTDVAAYAAEYERYFARNASRATVPLTMLDPAPRVVLDPVLGFLTAGRTARDAAIARDIALHTIDTIERAESFDQWVALPEGDIFDVEYWELEQAKLRRQGPPAPFAGEIALVTGAASGIGRATSAAFRAAGAAVVGLDLAPEIEELEGDDALGVQCDVTDDGATDRALAAAVDRFGGVDIVVCNAGVFPPSVAIDELTSDEWRRVMAVNVDANLALLRGAAPLLDRAPRGGRVVVNASKNVHAPGPGAAAYSASKAALTQLARVAALEWAPRGIRVNVVHPNAVFDTGVWDEATLASRAARYGLTVDEYKQNTLLGVSVTSVDVARVIVELCTATFAKTTGAQIPVDGGNDRIV
jgi:rhamnose utilization protein RhaD (predicted bifunctional aldolase and dehydrogenase)/NAD(P)-dependent dehydrogenase (short-subunit alcohol dehydrogenase family)